VRFLNKVILSGNLTKDVEVRYTQSGKAVVKIGLAVTRNFKNAEGERDADFFNFVAWDKTAEFFGKYLSKGTKILVEGRIQNNNYKDNNGVQHYAQDIIVENVEFAGAKKDSAEKPVQTNSAGEPVDNDDDLPF